MVVFRILIPWLLVFLSTLPAGGAPQHRPSSGIGLAIIRPPLSPPSADNGGIAIYREPGVGRIAEIELRDLPPLTPVLKGDGEASMAVVAGKRGNWLRIIYDPAGREGWLLTEKYWEFVTWEFFLKGKEVRLLPGLKKDLYNLFNEPSGAAGILSSLSRQSNLRIIKVQDNWCYVLADHITSGWIRWRDDNGLFLIRVDERFLAQNH